MFKKGNRATGHPLQNKKHSFRLVFLVAPSLAKAIEHFNNYPIDLERKIVRWSGPTSVAPATPVESAKIVELQPARVAPTIIARSADVPRSRYGFGTYFR